MSSQTFSVQSKPKVERYKGVRADTSWQVYKQQDGKWAIVQIGMKDHAYIIQVRQAGYKTKQAAIADIERVHDLHVTPEFRIIRWPDPRALPGTHEDAPPEKIKRWRGGEHVTVRTPVAVYDSRHAAGSPPAFYLQPGTICLIKAAPGPVYPDRVTLLFIDEHEHGKTSPAGAPFQTIVSHEWDATATTSNLIRTDRHLPDGVVAVHVKQSGIDYWRLDQTRQLFPSKQPIRQTRRGLGRKPAWS